MLKTKTLFLSCFYCLALFITCFVPISFAQQTAEQIFASIEPSVFQIQIIETKSASQVALGTGFLVEGNRIATNYHVISNVVLEPKKHRIQIRIGNSWVALNIITVDVVNDLALLEPQKLQLAVGSTELPVATAEEIKEASDVPVALTAQRVNAISLNASVENVGSEDGVDLGITALDGSEHGRVASGGVAQGDINQVDTNEAELKQGNVAINAKPFVLATKLANQGSILYSLGNPHNIGMTVVQGNYNGFAEHSFLERIHFSGAVNSGMSGGPTVNSVAEVVGINVASAGNQIGFLVPVARLIALMSKADSLHSDYDLLQDMALQIGAHTDAMVEDLLRSNWPTESLGGATILGKVVEWMDCWGNSEDNPETGINEIARGCSNADKMYISGRLNTSFFEYEYFYNEMPGWPVSAFYRKWAMDTSATSPGNRASRRDVKNYECVNQTVTTHANSPQVITRRASYCVRPYKKLPGLFDVFFIGVSSDKARKGVMDHFTLAGVTRASADAFLTRFVGVLAWQ